MIWVMNHDESCDHCYLEIYIYPIHGIQVQQQRGDISSYTKEKT